MVSLSDSKCQITKLKAMAIAPKVTGIISLFSSTFIIQRPSQSQAPHLPSSFIGYEYFRLLWIAHVLLINLADPSRGSMFGCWHNGDVYGPRLLHSDCCIMHSHVQYFLGNLLYTRDCQRVERTPCIQDREAGSAQGTSADKDLAPFHVHGRVNTACTTDFGPCGSIAGVGLEWVGSTMCSKDLLAVWVTNLDEPLDPQTLRNLEGDRVSRPVGQCSNKASMKLSMRTAVIFCEN
eukprot:scaffold11504_cov125-Skeletonema_dohrnii-CCMP3373.AAC.3